MDRISRNVGDFAKLIEKLNSMHTAFICIKEQFDTSTPMGRAMMNIAAVFAQLERETIAERIKDNIVFLARTGRRPGGVTPLGYSAEKTENREAAISCGISISAQTAPGAFQAPFSQYSECNQLSMFLFIFLYISTDFIGLAITRLRKQLFVRTTRKISAYKSCFQPLANSNAVTGKTPDDVDLFFLTKKPPYFIFSNRCNLFPVLTYKPL